MNGPQAGEARRESERDFWVGFARAAGGAVLFGLPLLMTMEMWWLGFSIDRLRLALFMIALFPLLVGLSHFSGFQVTRRWSEDGVDAAVAYGVGFLAAAGVLVLIGRIGAGMAVGEVVGKISLQAVPASMGAVLANSQLAGDVQHGDKDHGEGRGTARKEHAGYGAELFLMLAGALFFAFNLAPTEEVVLIALRATPWHAIALSLASLVLMHAFVYGVNFRGEHGSAAEASTWQLFLRFSVPGYAVALVTSAAVLWVFGRFAGGALGPVVLMVVVLGFPASLGAAAARLIL